MSLPKPDLDYLAERIASHSVSVEAGMVCVVLPKFPLPAGYDREQSDLLLRLNAGFPDVPPDMWWFDPPIRRGDGGTIQATECSEFHLGRSWQRWSRHLNPGQWMSGVDRLENFVALITNELNRCVTG